MGKVLVFVFMFIDNISKEVHRISIVLEHNGSIIWTMDKDDVEGHKQWAMKHLEWQQKVHRKVCDYVKQLHPKLASQGKNEFADFKLKQKCEENKSKMINLEESASALPRLYLVKEVMVHKMKYMRGPHPQSGEWQKIFTEYKKIDNHYIFEVSGEDPQIKPLTEYSVPDTGVVDKTNMNSAWKYMSTSNQNTMANQNMWNTNQTQNMGTNNMSQKGGDKEWKQLYMKYKSKYNALKDKH